MVRGVLGLTGLGVDGSSRPVAKDAQRQEKMAVSTEECDHGNSLHLRT